MAGNMPPGFGRRPGDHEHFDYPDPDVGCDDCGAVFFERVSECSECGSTDLTRL